MPIREHPAKKRHQTTKWADLLNQLMSASLSSATSVLPWWTHELWQRWRLHTGSVAWVPAYHEWSICTYCQLSGPLAIETDAERPNEHCFLKISSGHLTIIWQHWASLVLGARSLLSQEWAHRARLGMPSLPAGLQEHSYSWVCVVLLVQDPADGERGREEGEMGKGKRRWRLKMLHSQNWKELRGLENRRRN